MSGEVRVIETKMTTTEIQQLAKDTFGDMIKLVADIEKGTLAAGGSMHYESENLLLENGSRQENLWGANYYWEKPTGSRVEYVSLINIRPAANNQSQEIESPQIREKVKQAIENWIGQS